MNQWRLYSGSPQWVVEYLQKVSLNWCASNDPGERHDTCRKP